MSAPDPTARPSTTHQEVHSVQLSVIIPVYNEADNLEPLYQRLTSVLGAIDDTQHELLFIDDGSTDASAAKIQALAENDAQVRLLKLSRNFGHEAASTCGFDHADGDAVVLIDADLQDPPEVIPAMLDRWRDGAMVVYGRRRRRRGESWFKRTSSALFYRLLQRVSDVPIPTDTGDFRLIDRRVVHVLRRCREDPRFVRGLVSWAGFRQEAVDYDRDARHAGETKYRPLALIKLSLVAISAFSSAPLRWAGYLGGAVAVFSLAFTAYIGISGLLAQEPTPRPGYGLLICAVFFLGGIHLIMLSVMTYYIGLSFNHTRRRPIYVLDDAEILSPIPQPESLV